MMQTFENHVVEDASIMGHMMFVPHRATGAMTEAVLYHCVIEPNKCCANLEYCTLKGYKNRGIILEQNNGYNSTTLRWALFSQWMRKWKIFSKWWREGATNERTWCTKRNIVGQYKHLWLHWGRGCVAYLRKQMFKR